MNKLFIKTTCFTSFTKLLCLLLLCFSFVFATTQSVYAQDKYTITGKITNASDTLPISGASVLIKQTNKGTFTDEAGYFSIDVLKGQTLVITEVSHVKQEITIRDSSKINISLQAIQQNLNDVVVVGYGTQTRKDVTGSVSTVDVSKTFRDRPLNDPTRALQGAAPGLSISYSNGGIAASATIRLRGIGSLTGSSSPLILVDNVETDDLSVVNPDDIQSISVLKDAASASIYGARAAFGVILIKTKSPTKNQKTTVRYSNNFYWSTPTKLPDFADPTKELPGIIAADQRAGVTPETFGMNLEKLDSGITYWKEHYANNRKGNEMVKGEDFDLIDNVPYFYRIWDVKKMMLRSQPGQLHNLTISGGSEKIAYNINAGYSYDGGIMRINPDQVKKYNISAAVNATITNWWEVNVKMLYRNYEYDYPYGYYGATQNYFYYMWRWGAYWPYGTYQGKYFRNIPGYLNAAPVNSVKDNYTRVDIGSTLKIAKGLDVRLDYSIVRDNALRHITGGPALLWDNWSTGLPFHDVSATGDKVSEFDQSRYNTNIFNGYATYETRFNDIHHLKLMAGVNAQNNNGTSFSLSRLGLLDPNVSVPTLATGAYSGTSTIPESAFGGVFGRVNYDYKDKYLIELNTRRDGSSSFSPTHRWAYFSSGSLGYRISKENFMDFIKPLFTDWKFRASYGEIGNQDIGNALFLPTMPTLNANWIVGGIPATTIGAPNSVNYDLLWERIRTLNIGTDMSLLHDNLNVTFDWFQRSNIGMLATPQLPATFGVGAPPINDGSMRTTGWELNISGTWPINNDLALYGTAMITDYKAKITKWNNPSELINQNFKGATYGDIWGFVTDRLFTQNDFETNGNGISTLKEGIPDQTLLQSGNFVFGPGDIKYKDLNGDGKIDGGGSSASNHGDLKVIGNTQPRYIYSFRVGGSYKNFDLDAFFQGVGKQSYWGTGDVVMPNFRGGDILYAHQLDYWTPENTDAKYPNPFAGNASGNIAGIASGGNNFYPQTKFLLNTAYLRLKNISIGYTLPHDLLARYGLQSVRIYASGENLITFSKLNVPLDPEALDGYSSATGRTFPIQKMYSFGIQIKLQ